MREAEKKLEEAQRKGAVEKQEEAIRELEQAKADLEEILRQLREEEIERMLAMLEARFPKMLQMQRDVLEGHVAAGQGARRPSATHNHEIEAGRLSSKEAEIVLEADKALMLLREDGTAVAFPEALGQARQDMQQVVERLARGQGRQDHAGHRGGHHRRAGGNDRGPEEGPKKLEDKQAAAAARPRASRRTRRWSTCWPS